MVRRRAIITQADVARAIRAARQEGAHNVEIKPDGRIVINLKPHGDDFTTVDDDSGIVL
jgi:peptidoglycan/xylan/chitin deacetylase (PgdA/CDA1 family)